MSSTAPLGAGAPTANGVLSSTASPSDPSGVSASTALPGYYTAYLAQQQHQAAAHPPAAAGYYPGYPYSSPYPYGGYYPQQQPPASHPSPHTSNGTAAAPAPPVSTSATTAAPSTGTADPAAVAAYQQEYAEWYRKHYEPYMAAQAAAQQQAAHYTHPAHAQAPAVPSPSSAYPPAHSASPAGYPPTTTASALSAGASPYPYHTPQPAAYPPHSYPPHPYPSAPSSPAATLSNPPPTSTTLPQPPPPSASRRSRWSGSSPDPSPTPHPPSSSISPSGPPVSSTPTPPVNPSAVASAWPPDLLDYVKRSLQFCPAHSKTEVERFMRERIQSAVNAGDVHRIDWRAEPLAHQRMLADALKAKFAHSPAHPSPAPSPPDDVKAPSPQADARHHSRAERKRARDSSESSDDDDPHAPRPDRLSARQRRARRHSPSKGQWAVDAVDRSRNSDRASRFSAYLQEAAAAPMKSRIRTELFSASSHGGSGEGEGDEGGIDWSALKIVGTSTALEKSYFRLTSAPDPATVRPPAVLRVALERVLAQWREAGEYGYLCDQVKAIRQDLTVQHVQDAFTVLVYEAHARVALQVGDLSEYNQCQTQLRALYAEVGDADPAARAHEVEFLMYRLCYLIITGNQGAISALLRELGEGQRGETAIAHVLRMRRAVAVDDFYTFLRGYRQTPYGGVHLLRHVVGRMRLMGLRALVRGYKPMKVEVRMFQESLGFGGREECVRYLVNCGAVVSDDEEVSFIEHSQPSRCL